jgi:hypothetical protein
MLKINYKNLNWQYLLVCATGLALGLTGWNPGFVIAVVMAAVQGIHTIIIQRSLTAFPAQVHITYALLLLAALPGPMNWLYWMPAIGTWIYLLFDYCLLARLMSLLPFNSGNKFSLRLVRATFLAQPVHNILKPA